MVARFNLNVDQSIQMDGTMKVVWYPSREGEWVRYTDYADRIAELEAKLANFGGRVQSDVYVLSLLTKIDELEAKHQWQPIETAPKDGTEIFIYRYGWPWAPVAKWVEYPGNPVLDENEQDTWMYGWLFNEWFTPGNEDGWLGWSDDEMPTYWMPLPEPPQQEKDDE